MGFGAGYYLGSKAGRERYEQINEWISKVKGSDTYEQVVDVADSKLGKAKDLVESKLGTTDGVATTGVGTAPNAPITPAQAGPFARSERSPL